MQTSKSSSDQPRPGKFDRVATQMRGLVEDLRTWIDLKVRLIELQVEEKVRRLARRVAVSVAVAGIALLGILFGLTAAALALGAWWGSTAVGFLAVSLLLILVAGLMFVLRNRLAGTSGAVPDPLPPHPEPARLAAPDSSAPVAIPETEP